MYTTSSHIAELIEFCSLLSFLERKALITLSRAQDIPDSETSPLLFSKVQPILDKFSRYPPFRSLRDSELTEAGKNIIPLIQSPLSCGMVLVFALGTELSDQAVKEGKETSFRKELLATQTIRRKSEWNWDAILRPDEHRGEVIHPLFPYLSPLQKQFSSNIHRLESRYRNKIILPHYTRRGVSSESKRLLEHRVFSGRIRKLHGSPHTFHRNTDWSNVSSLDVIHHFVRTGFWVEGKTELKQRWYPNGLLPRTYFSWGGFDIAVSTYLRTFFNDLADLFDPTERHNRVRPDWLKRYESPSGGFLFYDLTSFTSWFHEQVPFLRALGDRFAHLHVFLLGENLTLKEYSIGTLIHSYTDYCTDFPSFCIHDDIMEGLWRGTVLPHLCAGFLGIPGNLITCTIPHGLAIAANFDIPREVQTAGDDVGTAFYSEQHADDINLCASTLGTLQYEKVYRTPEMSLFLKRRVIESGNAITLAQMLIYPLLPYLVSPSSSKTRSNRFRMPLRKDIFKRTASVLVTFHRDLWNMTKGELSVDEADFIFDFLRYIHDKVGLPYGAIFQGCLNGDSLENQSLYDGIKMKFSVEDISDLYSSPDRTFAGKYIYRMTLRDVSEVTERTDFGDLAVGERFTVRRGRGWKFLEDMGYIKITGTSGEKIDLVGAAARDAYMRASEPPYREVEVLSELHIHQLRAVGIVDEDGELFSNPAGLYVDPSSQSYRFRPYIDLDDPRSSDMHNRPVDGMQYDIFSESDRDGLSPEPDILSLY